METGLEHYRRAMLAGIALFVTAPCAAQEALDNAAATATEGAIDVSRNVTPLRYAVSITPDLMARTFRGRVEIKVRVDEPTDAIRLHAENLAITEATIAGQTASAMLLSADRMVALKTENPVPAGEHTLVIAYNGQMSAEYKQGLFVEKDANTGLTGMFSHFQTEDARTVFPAWDEPGIKTPFDIAITASPGKIAISNMPVESKVAHEDGSTTFTFRTTPVMSTYLLFFAVGKFAEKNIVKDGTSYSVYAMSEQGLKGTDLALNSMPDYVNWFSTYFGMPYAQPKLDMILAQRAGNNFLAMENWGAILSFENIMRRSDRVYNDNQSSILWVTGHEIAHQWLGNVVTPKSWKDLWLSEGLTSWAEEKANKEIRPKLMKPNSFFGAQETDIRQSLVTLLGDEARFQMPPLVSEVFRDRHTEVQAATTVYLKGAALARMLEQWAGELQWQDVMRTYLTQNKDGAVDTGALIDAMEAKAIHQSRAIVEDFTNSTGVPIIGLENMQCQNGRLTFSLRLTGNVNGNGSAGVSSKMVPFMWKSLDDTDMQKAIVTSLPQSFRRDSCNAIDFNASDAGYYLVNPADTAWPQWQSRFAELPPKRAAYELSENKILAEAGLTPFSRRMTLLNWASSGSSPDLISQSLTAYHGYLKLLYDNPAAHTAMSLWLNQKLTRLTIPQSESSPHWLALKDLLTETKEPRLKNALTAKARSAFASKTFANGKPESSFRKIYGALGYSDAYAYFVNPDTDIFKRILAEEMASAGSDTEPFYTLGRTNNKAQQQLLYSAIITKKLKPAAMYPAVTDLLKANPALIEPFFSHHFSGRENDADGYALSLFDEVIPVAPSESALAAIEKSLAKISDRELQDFLISTIATRRADIKKESYIKKQLLGWIAAKGWASDNVAPAK